ncbi:lipopolysaccharide biosynthesis protein [Roseateles aquatilis]|uniref:Lipopolysaccharide biosynthesis protein n=2 Tax=Roseateles aquatilis TaxID=431061 RepID=A0A246J4I3_9BURK|nr:lipopolysaccharide biosynthesis protein [Roseateles aquatilis]
MTMHNNDQVHELLSLLGRSWRTLASATVLTGALALGVTYLIQPTFTAKASFLPPQQQQSSSAAALASLGALASLAGSGAVKSPTDQFISLMQSVTVSDRIIDQFHLMDVYEAKLRSVARQRLDDNVRMQPGKKDGLIYIEVDDHDPKRAADMANRYINELQRMTSGLALSEAAQRRVFFETQLKQTRDRLTLAQQALQVSGFSAGDLKSEPRAAAESYARLKAEQTAAEVRLRTLQSTLSDNSSEVQRARATLAALEVQIGKAEAAGAAGARQQDGYVSRYRDYKYEEALFDIFARQFELAKSDESREGSLIQIIDPALVPDHKSKPRRAMTALGGAFAGLFAAMLYVVVASRRKPARAAA